ncbi:hypothetical protein M427DRAFT_159091 [Gonapodya prolifera JEL478]|uniref:F-box domain-containing protein n=1 Tax=Gonapodya prolifera (strain JEL478) TaxID=1344416 RepID=A0A139A1D2_GONPJ|nr:hypothetical protein M427DRAFT_159091 [Gonapodya prolifera JEL478]|eukprot:KXS10600.1 hypothetical protein M427DRAFT_159091 [Gonapodya prolifera JEL478]
MSSSLPTPPRSRSSSCETIRRDITNSTALITSGRWESDRIKSSSESFHSDAESVASLSLLDDTETSKPHLPFEIVVHILHFLAPLGDDVFTNPASPITLGPFDAVPQAHRDHKLAGVKALAACQLVSRALFAESTKLLYRSVRMRSKRHRSRFMQALQLVPPRKGYGVFEDWRIEMDSRTFGGGGEGEHVEGGCGENDIQGPLPPTVNYAEMVRLIDFGLRPSLREEDENTSFKFPDRVIEPFLRTIGPACCNLTHLSLSGTSFTHHTLQFLLRCVGCTLTHLDVSYSYIRKQGFMTLWEDTPTEEILDAATTLTERNTLVSAPRTPLLPSILYFDVSGLFRLSRIPAETLVETVDRLKTLRWLRADLCHEGTREQWAAIEQTLAERGGRLRSDTVVSGRKSFAAAVAA